MSLQDDAKTILAANGTLAAFFTGGIITFADLQETGLTRTSYPAAFDTITLRLKPTLVIKERAELPTNAIKDEQAQRTSAVQALEVWYYSPSSGSYTDLESKRAIVYGLFQDRGVGGKHLIRRSKMTMERDRALQNAAIIYDVWDAHGTVTA